ncbi:MAG: hypothetical protein L0Z53_23325 [Acidobacteriales bacterium]|nr:hypothetical protein [Terriglobales bacterium]
MADKFRFEDLATAAVRLPELKAPARLKSRTYTALIRAQQQAGALLDLTATKEHGGHLCVFEQLVQIAPIGQKIQSKFICHSCHARALAEAFEHAPIYWRGCPYVRFQD